MARSFERSRDMGSPEQPIFSGSQKSQLGKYVGGEVRLRPDQKWMKKLAHDLILRFPEANTQVVIDFINSLPEDQRGRIATQLLEVIEMRPQGILRAPDQEEALKSCIDEVKKNNKLS